MYTSTNLINSRARPTWQHTREAPLTLVFSDDTQAFHAVTTTSAFNHVPALFDDTDCH